MSDPKPAIPYRQMIDTTRAALAERFPQIIRAKKSHAPKVPLAIGIDKAIVAAAPDLTPKHIKLTIRDYVTGPKYLQAIIAGGPRYAIDGSEDGAVTDNQRAHADQALKTYRKREKHRRPKPKIAEPDTRITPSATTNRRSAA